ncbi:MAG: hypothetical protein M0P91_05370 [Sulfuricurvum sp.]|jgi:hypothetical protein|uniref:hypothetical protein n=1 Tax=Sulfuricurvum sp. TaxID=2025608 RepID=UPI0025CC1651|nr:hypothetical protein [Sulfuricurvum sp.]MCK9372606.1 hypothetical protein [Sulfuricurvum sp.]
MDIDTKIYEIFDASRAVIAIDLIDSLSDYEKEYVKIFVTAIGKRKYWKMYYESLDDVEDFILLTPKKRKTSKRYDFKTKAVLTLMSLHYMQHSLNYLKSYNEHVRSLGDRNLSLRELTVAYGSAHAHIKQFDTIVFWLF